MKTRNTLVVVSHYAARPRDSLVRLTAKLGTLTDEIVVVVNDAAAAAVSVETCSGPVCATLTRPNTGMNIGAWDAALHAFPGRDFYIFLQDECEVLIDDFLDRYVSELSRDGVGMTGETINPKWESQWETIARSPLNYVVGVDANRVPVSRVNYYLLCMKRWGISPGATGRHLRALVWAFNGPTLARIGGFPIGRSKEECIAAEIAVSKKVEELGLSVTQISDSPFKYVSHLEWRRDGLSKV